MTDVTKGSRPVNNPARPSTRHSHLHAPSPDVMVGASSEDVAECPVMVGTPVVKSDAEAEGLVREYDGRRYWLCCDTCADLFDGDPDGYTEAA